MRRIAALDHLAHRGEIVHAGDGLHLEFAIGRLVHLAVFPHHQRGDGFRALDVRDVEALDAAGKLGQHERVGERLLDGLARRLQHAEALRVGLVGVLAGEIDEGFLVAALRHGDFDLVAGALGEERGEGFAVVEVGGDEDRARDVVLVDVELLEEGGEDGAGVEGGLRSLSSPRSQNARPGAPGSVAPSGLKPPLRFRAEPVPQHRHDVQPASSAQLQQVGQVFPEKLAAVDDLAVAHVEEIDGQATVLEVIAEDVGVVVEFGGGDALFLLELVHG